MVFDPYAIALYNFPHDRVSPDQLLRKLQDLFTALGFSYSGKALKDVAHISPHLVKCFFADKDAVTIVLNRAEVFHPAAWPGPPGPDSKPTVVARSLSALRDKQVSWGRSQVPMVLSPFSGYLKVEPWSKIPTISPRDRARISRPPQADDGASALPSWAT